MQFGGSSVVGSKEWGLANRRGMIEIIAMLSFIALSTLGLFLFARDPYSEHEIHQLNQRAYNHQRPGGGRLSAAAYTPINALPPSTVDLGRAQILLLRRPDSVARR